MVVAAVAFVLLAAGAGAFAIFGSHHHQHRYANVNFNGATTSYSETYTDPTSSSTDTYATDTNTTGTYDTQTDSASTATAAPTTTTKTTTTHALPAGACVAPSAKVQLHNGVNLSCPFAQNIVTQLAAAHRPGDVGPTRLRVSSPATGLTYTVTCTRSGRTFDCHNDQSADADRGDRNNDVTFPASLIR